MLLLPAARSRGFGHWWMGGGAEERETSERKGMGSRGVEVGGGGRERGGGIERWGSGSLTARVRRVRWA